jgi:phosphoribosylaminoimidazole-succinocarboxamide synthase
VRDWASGSGWDKKPPAPEIPEDVVAGTRARYVEAYELIVGEPFDQWLKRAGAEAEGAPEASAAPRASA